ncbi:CAP domain-containing protein, partial [Clostridium perfringens]
DVNIKNKKGEVEKVESVDNGSIKVTSGETIGSKTENKVQASQQPSGEKVEKVEDIKGTTASSEGSITIVKPSKEESSSKPESNKQEQPEESKPEEAPQPSQK